MRYLFVIVFSLLLWPTDLSAQTSRPKLKPLSELLASTQGNAADLYRKAFADLPKDADARLIARSKDGSPIDAQINALAAKYDGVARLMNEAISVNRCDWGLDRTKGPTLELPFLNPAQGLSELFMLRSRVHAKAGRYDVALDEAFAMLVFARRIGNEPFLLCKIVECGTTMATCETVAKWLPSAPVDATRAFAARLATSLPQSLTAAKSFEQEINDLADWLARPENADANKLFGPGSLLAPREGDEAGQRAAAAAIARWKDPLMQKQEIAIVRAVGSAGAKVISATGTDLRPAYEAWSKTLSSSPVATYMAAAKPTTLRIVANMSEVTFLEFDAALSIRLNGPSALAKSKDPFGTGPFTREDGPEGSYVLKSQFTTKDGPVKLKVGSAGETGK